MPTIDVKCTGRIYHYIAWLRKDGKLEAITAGCRNWSSFKKAFRHYSPENDYKPYRNARPFNGKASRWSDDWLKSPLFDATAAIEYRQEREWSIKALKKLQKRVKEYRAKLKNKKKSAKKARRRK